MTFWTTLLDFPVRAPWKVLLLVLLAIVGVLFIVGTFFGAEVPQPAFVPVPQFVPVPVFAPTTKFIQVVKRPGYWEQAFACPNCPKTWVPPVMGAIEVLAKIAPEDERALVAYHYRLGPASCGMSWCVTHRTQELVDDQGNPAPPGANASDGKGMDTPSTAAAGQGWYLGKNLRKLRGR